MITVKNVSKDDFEAWRGNALTQEVFKAIQQQLDTWRADLGRGVGLDKDNANRTQANAFEHKGRCDALVEVLNMSVD